MPAHSGGLRPAIFLDRDGVLNDPVPDPFTGTPESPLSVDDVHLTGDAAAAVRRINRAELPVFIVSNQPSAAKGRVSVDQLRQVHDVVIQQLAAHAAVIEASYLCLHHPQGTVPDLTLVCDCRKPGPGLLRQAARDHGLDLGRSWLIGDTDADVGAAHNAGVAGVVIVRHPLSSHRRTPSVSGAVANTDTLVEAVNTVLVQLAADAAASDS